MNSRLCVLLLLIPLSLVGCFGNQKRSPVADIFVDAGSMDRQNYEVLDPVEGQSTTTSILLGLIQIVDGSKVRILYIPFFTEEYAIPPDTRSLCGRLFAMYSTAAHAYYAALAQSPEADAVLRKSMDVEYQGFPLLFSSKRVTYRGKALKLKTDNDLNPAPPAE